MHATVTIAASSSRSSSLGTRRPPPRAHPPTCDVLEDGLAQALGGRAVKERHLAAVPLLRGDGQKQGVAGIQMLVVALLLTGACAAATVATGATVPEPQWHSPTWKKRFSGMRASHAPTKQHNLPPTRSSAHAHEAAPPPTWRKRLSAMSTQIIDSSSGSMKLSALAMAINTSSFTRAGTPCRGGGREARAGRWAGRQCGVIGW